MLLFALMMACSSEPQAPAPAPVTEGELAASAAASICAAAIQAGQSCEAEGAVATLGWDALEVQVSGLSWLTLDPTSIGRGPDAQRFPGEAQLGAVMGLSRNGAALFAVEQSHAASDVDLHVARAAVLDELAQRWVVTHASAVLDAGSGDPGAPVLAALGMNVPAQPQGALHAWAGYPVLRGKGFDPGAANRLGPGVQSMLSAIGPFVEGLPADGLQVVQVQAKLGGSGAPGPCGIIPPMAMTPGTTTSIVPLSGRVLVNGQPTGDICVLSEPVAWPLPPQGSVLEWDQLIVLAPNQAGAPAVELAPE
jgi:hypothetical protein